MTTAPRDGTLILVCETANGEHWNVLPACYMSLGAQGYHDPRTRQDVVQDAGQTDWWAIAPTRYTDDPGTLPTRFKPLASTPVCWQPLPALEAPDRLRRRLAALLRERRPTER